MFFTKDQYKKTINDFLQNHHGMMVKISDDDGKVFGYIFRAEAKKNDSKNIVFSIVPDFFYFKGHLKPSITEIKFYGIKRILTKWKKVKKELYVNLSDCVNDDILSSIISDVEQVKEMYSQMKIDYNIDVNKVASYIHKNLKAIEKYYKNKDDIKIIFL